MESSFYKYIIINIKFCFLGLITIFFIFTSKLNSNPDRLLNSSQFFFAILVASDQIDALFTIISNITHSEL